MSETRYGPSRGSKLALWAFLTVVITGLWTTSFFVAPARSATLPPPCPPSASWTASETYQRGMFCLSSGTDVFAFQTDGNLVWYIAGVAQWNSGTAGTGQTLALQGDGNVVVYAANGKAVYASSWGYNQAVFTTSDQSKSLTIALEGDHVHSVTHRIDVSPTVTGGSALNGLQWQEVGPVTNCSYTINPVGVRHAFNVRTPPRSVSPGQFCWSNDWGTLVFQTDGNFVEYASGRARWNSGTYGRGAHLAFQSDGNIVVYNAAGAPIWAISMVSHSWQARDLTHGNGFLYIEVLQNSGIYYVATDNVHDQSSYWAV